MKYNFNNRNSVYNRNRKFQKIENSSISLKNQIAKQQIRINRNIQKEKPDLGDIWMVELQPSGQYCLHGNHFCVILDKIGSNYRVVPITINRNNIHVGEYSLQKGRFGLYKDSKLVLHQIRPASIETLKYKFNKVDDEVLKVIGNFLVNQAHDLFDHAA